MEKKSFVQGMFSFDCECGQKYKLLGIIKGSLKILAWMFLVLGILISPIVLIFGGTPEMPRAASVQIFFFAIFEFLFVYAVSELIEIMVNIENNTLKTARLLGAREE